MWFFIALIAPFLWSIVNHADKYLLSKHSTNSTIGSLMIFSTFAGVIVLFVSPFYVVDIFNISLIHALTLILVGLIIALSIMLYLFALNEDETSLVVPFTQLIPVFGYFFGYLFLGETLSSLQMSGVAIIIVGAGILSLEFEEESGLRIKKRLICYMIGMTILAALCDTVFKFIAVDAGFWKSAFWEHIGLILFGCILYIFFKRYRQDFIKIFNYGKNKYEIISINIISEILTLIGNLLTHYALLLAPVALVLVVSSYQPAFVFMWGIILTLFLPHLATEKISKKHLLHKIASIGIIFVGSYLLFI